MSAAFRMCLAFAVQSLIPRCTAQDYKEWQGGDWAHEIIRATPEPVGNTNEWVHYLNTLGQDYEEYPEKRTSKKPFHPDDVDLLQDPPDWYPLAAHEDPYLAIIYRRDVGPDRLYKLLFPDEPDPGSSHVSPGTSCGGALLASKHVLTSCGCLLTLITTVFGYPNPFSRPGTATYDIFDNDRNVLPPIYVSRVVTDFKPDFKHQIDTDKKKWSIFDSLHCQYDLATIQRRSDLEEARQIAILNAAPALVPFSPEIKTDFLRFFPKWPPVIINKVTDPTYKARADLISIGMKLSKPGRYQFFSSISGSITEMKHCRAESLVCNTTRVRQEIRNSCYCPVRPGIHKLAGGVIGWPIVTMGALVGITASERHPTDGTVLAIVMHSTLTNRIEEHISRKVLEDQNTPPPQYRERSLRKKFLIYDYDIYKGKIKTRSRATFIGPTPAAFVFYPAAISWILAV